MSEPDHGNPPATLVKEGSGKDDKDDKEDKGKGSPAVKVPKKPGPKAKAKTKGKAKPSPKKVMKKPGAPMGKVKAKPASSADKKKQTAKAKASAMKTTPKKEKTSPNKGKKNKPNSKKKDNDGAKKRPAAKAPEPEDKKAKSLWSGLDKADPKDDDLAQQQEHGEEEKDFENDDEVDAQEESQVGAKKDRCKNQKFKQMLASNSLPQWVVNVWDRTTRLKTGKSEAQRNLINAIFDRTSVGKLLLSLGKPFFHSLKEHYTDKAQVDKSKALPKSLFKGKFNLSEQGKGPGAD